MTDHLPTSSSDPSNPKFVVLVQREIGDTFQDASPAPNRIVEPNRELHGLALSGGGIRSATFNLGLAQGLHRLGLLRSFDYLSTVSGGGYFGSFWSAWRTRPENADKVFPDVPAAPDFPEAREIRHLREFSNFLTPRIGITSWDTGRMLVTALSSMLPSLLAAVSLLLLAVLAWCGVAYGLFAGEFSIARFPRLDVPAVIMGSITLVLTALGEVLWRRRGEWTGTKWVSRIAYVVATLWAVAATVIAWSWLASNWPPYNTAYRPGQRLPVISEAQGLTEWLYLLMPAAAWLLALLSFTLLRWITSRFAKTDSERMIRASFDRAHARVLLTVLVWMVFALVWAVGVWVYAWFSELKTTHTQVGATTGLATVYTFGMALFAWVQKRFGQQPNKPAGGKLMAAIKPLLPQLLAYAVVITMAVYTVALLVAADQRWRNAIGIAAVGSCAVMLAVLFWLNPNEVGLHAFYRGRIARAYPGASILQGWRKSEEQPKDDIDLPDLSRTAPLHLICCAANDISSSDTGNLNRGAESAVLSRAGFSVAEEWLAWDEGSPVPTLAGAATASGAAFNSLMGAKTIELGPAVTFLMAAFNLRLGLWLPHPTRSHEQTLDDRWLSGRPFLKEMFGRARSRGSDVHLSDGAHFENLAIYELVRRHCRVIVATDCGMDPEVAFDDFGVMVRRVREDFGVEIRIDLSPLRPDPATGLARQPMVSGDIHYPEGDTGILLFFKPTLVGNEPADVTQYRTRNKAFPHETTGDQFYDEAQWESYRRLGEHAAVSAFETLARGLKREKPHYPAEVFDRARREWLPAPEGFADRVSHLADRLAELDALLREDETGTLRREVYKEVDELDRWGKTHHARKNGDEDRTTEPSPAAGQGPAGDAGGGAKGPWPFPEGRNLAASLHLIRRALLVFEESYEREGLERSSEHPVYLGLTNYMARWAYAPLFRMWWPILKTLYPQPFTRFMERQFGLAGVGDDGESREHVEGRLSTLREGFAMEAWTRQGCAAPKPDDEVVSYSLSMRYREFNPPYDVQAAQVIAKKVGDILVWDADDFFVPPGLWGVGIGSDFLRKLKEADKNPLDVKQLLVRIRVEGGTGTTAGAGAAGEMQLYRSGGFERTTDPKISPDALPARRSDRRNLVRWMRADVGTSAATNAAEDAPATG
jgi:hypothetical protein